MGFIGYADHLMMVDVQPVKIVLDDALFAAGGNTEISCRLSDGQVTFDKGAPGSANQVIARGSRVI